MMQNKYYFLLTDPRWDILNTTALVFRWVWQDLTGRGAVQSRGIARNARELARGLKWCVLHLPRAVRVRRAHHVLLTRGPEFT